MIARLPIAPNFGTAGISAAQVLALLLPVIVSLVESDFARTGILLAALATAAFWDIIFSATRKRGFAFHGVTVALIVTILAPPYLLLWQLVLMLSLALVLGEHIFGGRGFGFLSPAAIALSLLVFSFPQVSLTPVSQSVAIATLPGAVLLLLLGLISWRIILATLAALIALLLLSNYQIDALSLGIALTLGITFLICDPTSAASTNPGRWLFGLLAGALIFLFSGSGDLVTPQGIVFASLTASIFAPLLDHLVVLVDAKRRSRQRA